MNGCFGLEFFFFFQVLSEIVLKVSKEKLCRIVLINQTKLATEKHKVKDREVNVFSTVKMVGVWIGNGTSSMKCLSFSSN